jgi:hypothetical protein
MKAALRAVRKRPDRFKSDLRQHTAFILVELEARLFCGEIYRI